MKWNCWVLGLKKREPERRLGSSGKRRVAMEWSEEMTWSTCLAFFIADITSATLLTTLASNSFFSILSASIALYFFDLYGDKSDNWQNCVIWLTCTYLLACLAINLEIKMRKLDHGWFFFFCPRLNPPCIYIMHHPFQLIKAHEDYGWVF